MKKPNSLNSLCIKGYKELIPSKFTTYSPSTSLMYKGIETSWEKIRPLSWKPPNRFLINTNANQPIFHMPKYRLQEQFPTIAVLLIAGERTIARSLPRL